MGAQVHPASSQTRHLWTVGSASPFLKTPGDPGVEGHQTFCCPHPSPLRSHRHRAGVQADFPFFRGHRASGCELGICTNKKFPTRRGKVSENGEDAVLPPGTGGGTHVHRASRRREGACLPPLIALVPPWRSSGMRLLSSSLSAELSFTEDAAPCSSCHGSEARRWLLTSSVLARDVVCPQRVRDTAVRRVFCCSTEDSFPH